MEEYIYLLFTAWPAQLSSTSSKEDHLDYHHPASPYPAQLGLVASTYA